MIPTSPKSEFDHFAADYDTALNRGIAVSGEGKEYFADGRVRWLKGCVARLNAKTESVMDFGCGTGSATPFLLEHLQAEMLVGVEVSGSSLKVARCSHRSEKAEFVELAQYSPAGTMDLVYCNGVFHHIPPAERAGAVDYVRRSLRPGGIFGFWENNPWNPGTRYVMSRIPFDREAITLSAPEAGRLLKAGGFEVICTHFLFIFPKVLGWFRKIEPALSLLPLGAQYQVLCRKI